MYEYHYSHFQCTLSLWANGFKSGGINTIFSTVVWYIHLHPANLLRNWNNRINWLNGQQFKILNTLNFHCLFLGRFQLFKIRLLILSFASLVIVKAKVGNKQRFEKSSRKIQTHHKCHKCSACLSSQMIFFCIFAYFRININVKA